MRNYKGKRREPISKNKRQWIRKNPEKEPPEPTKGNRKKNLHTVKSEPTLPSWHQTFETRTYSLKVAYKQEADLVKTQKIRLRQHEIDAMLHIHKVTYKNEVGTLQKKKATPKSRHTKQTSTEQTPKVKAQTAETTDDASYKPPPAERLKNNSENRKQDVGALNRALAKQPQKGRDASVNEDMLSQQDRETTKGREYARQQRKSRSQRYSPKLSVAATNGCGPSHERQIKKQKAKKSEAKGHNENEYSKRLERQPIKDHQKPHEDKWSDRALTEIIFKTTQQIHRRYQKQEFIAQTEVLTFYIHAPPNFTPSELCALGRKNQTPELILIGLRGLGWSGINNVTKRSHDIFQFQHRVKPQTILICDDQYSNHEHSETGIPETFDIIECGGEGDCLYCAVAVGREIQRKDTGDPDQLPRQIDLHEYGPGSLKQRECRNIATEELLKSPESYSYTADDYETLAQHRKTGYAANTPSITALAHALKIRRNIYVIDTNTKMLCNVLEAVGSQSL